MESSEQSKWDDVLVAESVNKTAAFSIFSFFPLFSPHFLFLMCKLKTFNLFLLELMKVRVVPRCIPEKQWPSLPGGHRWEEAGSCKLQPLPARAETTGICVLNCAHKEVDDTVELIIKHSNVLPSHHIL